MRYLKWISRVLVCHSWQRDIRKANMERDQESGSRINFYLCSANLKKSGMTEGWSLQLLRIVKMFGMTEGWSLQLLRIVKMFGMTEGWSFQLLRTVKMFGMTEGWSLQLLRTVKMFGMTGVGILLSFSVYAGNVTEFTLKNGLKVFVKEDHRAPLVAVQLWYKVGSADEATGHTGISHLLEHMMFKGTEKYGPGEFDRIITEAGGTQNAFTARDVTAYIQVIPADKLDISLELEADRMQNLKMEQESFDKELQVVLEERRMRTEDNPKSLTYERFLAAAHIASPYHHPIIGWMDDISQVTRDQAREWYDIWYAPNNAYLVVVGDVQPKQVKKLVKKHFAKLKAKPEARRLPKLALKGLGKRELVVKAPAKLSVLYMGYNVPRYEALTESWEPYALIVLSEILDGGKSARLEKRLVRDQQIALKIGAHFSPYSRLNPLFIFSGVPAKDVTDDQLETAILAEIKDLQGKLVTDQELARVKAQVVASHVYEKDSMAGQASEIAGLEVLGLSWREADEYPKKIEAVTAEQVREVAKKYLISDQLTVATLEPLPIENGKDQAPLQLGEEHVH